MVVAPLPPEVFIPLAGFMVAQGELNPIAVIFSAVVGFLLSVLPWYLVGRYLGEKGLRHFLHRHRRWVILSTKDLEKATEWFQRSRGQAILLSLLLPGVRNIISIPAGISGMSFISFFLYTTIGAVVWLSGLMGIGYVLGSRYYLVNHYIGSVYNIIIPLLILAFLIWGVQRYLKYRTNKS